MVTFVLVHGACLGGWCWQRVSPLLREASCEVFTPTLTGLGERAHLLSPELDLETHVLDIAAVLECEDLRDVVLVGQSYGGMVITAAADRAASRIRRLVYLDAFVPADGQSLFDLSEPAAVTGFRERAATLGAGWRVPLNPPARFDISRTADLDWLSRRLRPQPLRTFDQRLKLSNGSVAGLPKTFIRCAGYPNFAVFGDRRSRRRSGAIGSCRAPTWRWSLTRGSLRHCCLSWPSRQGPLAFHPSSPALLP